MFILPSAILLLTAFLSFFAAGNPVVVDRSSVTLSISRQLKLASGYNLVQHEQARVGGLLKQRSAAKSTVGDYDPFPSEPIINKASNYIAQIGIGSPPTTYNLIVDTGSANTWIGANEAYQKTKTSIPTSDSVSAKYGTGGFSGAEYIDQLTLTPGLIVSRQSIGVANVTMGIQPNDGILGLGPQGLTNKTLSPHNLSTIPTVTDNLYSEGKILENLIGVYFEPTTNANETNGEIHWGFADPTKLIGLITYIPITSANPASRFWGINQSIRYGDATILSTTSGIVDTGNTLILIATDAFNKYKSATGGVPDNSTGLLSITSSQYSNLQSLYMCAGDGVFELTPNAQLWPRSLNTALGGVASAIYLVVNDIGSESKLGFSNGLPFLERYYSVYDTANQRVGLAATRFTQATTN